uniref:Uncharacterized protein n=1 Tax=Oryza nivara TaxID=4536 RepID=A0A0E0HFE5_ORYNI
MVLLWHRHRRRGERDPLRRWKRASQASVRRERCLWYEEELGGQPHPDITASGGEGGICCSSGGGCGQRGALPCGRRKKGRPVRCPPLDNTTGRGGEAGEHRGSHLLLPRLQSIGREPSKSFGKPT